MKIIKVEHERIYEEPYMKNQILKLITIINFYNIFNCKLKLYNLINIKNSIKIIIDDIYNAIKFLFYSEKHDFSWKVTQSNRVKLIMIKAQD